MGAATYQDESVITRIEAIEERIEDQRVRLSEHGTTVGHADNTRRVDALEDRMDRAEDERRELARTIESIDRKLYTVCMATTGGNESACRTIR